MVWIAYPRMEISLDPAVKPTLSVEEVAIVLGLARSSAYEAIRRGQIPSIRVGRRLLVPTAALCRLLGLIDSKAE
jgi:excisionase family DNA binding protein